MSLVDIDENDLKEILKAYFTPSREILDPKKLHGRQADLRVIDRAMNSPGRHVFIYGDRGVGKTSLARTAASLHNSNDEHEHIYIQCGKTASFGDAILGILGKSAPGAGKSKKTALGLGGGIPGLGNLSFSRSTEADSLPKPSNIIDALSIFKKISLARQGQVIVVIDEMERMSHEEDRLLFAELIKNLSTEVSNVRIIFCGIAQDIDDLLGQHGSVGRYMEGVPLGKIGYNYLWDIVTEVSKKIHIDISGSVPPECCAT